MRKVISRQDAQDQHLFYFFTQEPCSAGHIDNRYVSNGQCVQCSHGKKQQSSDRVGSSDIRRRAADIELAQELARIERDHQI